MAVFNGFENSSAGTACKEPQVDPTQLGSKMFLKSNCQAEKPRSGYPRSLGKLLFPKH